MLGCFGRLTLAVCTDEKNALLLQQRSMLEEFNMFLFDWNRYSKVRVALVLFSALL